MLNKVAAIWRLFNKKRENAVVDGLDYY